MSPDDVDYVSISHSHFDHIGQADQVAGSTWLVSQKELDAMFGEGAEIAQEQQALFSLFAPTEQKVFEDAESRELKRVPRFNSDEAMTVSSMEAFEARADALGAKVIIQHEPADIDPLEGKIR